MANPQVPPYPGFNPGVVSNNPGFNPYVAPSTGPYPEQQYPDPGQQFPPVQPFPPGQQIPLVPQYPAGAYPSAGQQFPQGQYPSAGQQFPQGQYPSAGQQFPQGQYPSEHVNPGFVPYGPPPMVQVPGPGGFKDETIKLDENVIEGFSSSFTDKAIRAAFIRKVYAILMVQLVFTFGVIALFVLEPHTKQLVQRHSYLYFVSYFIFLGVSLALTCCSNLRRNYPTNIILLSIFTLSMSYMLGTLSSFHDTDVVFLAVGVCAGVCFAVSVFSFYTKFDFTSCAGVLLILVWVLFLFGIIAIFSRSKTLHIVYALAGAIIFVLFLAYDTQMLVGGKKHELSAEEHIFAAMQIYLDIVQIFIFLLMIFGFGKK